MHEASLVRSLLRQVRELLVQHGGESIETIRVQMGPLSGVERTLVEIAFADQVDSSIGRGAELLIEEVPLTAVCCNCGCEFEIEQFHFVCVVCASSRVRITGGDEFLIKDITIRTVQSALTCEDAS